ncbi:CD48 antigen-like [Myripristis murdjan]|uniref:CD48 antigen-like n=1 Tax=Myripristis murdjan TaxID=586833 RepID=UPI00117640DC|nr:CD48 antigen [Myripristis murdjan]
MADTSLALTIFLFCLSGSMNVKAVTLYFRTGGTFTLDPGLPGIPRNILWTHGSDKAVEWRGQAEKLETYTYREFKDKSTLNLTTGALTVRDLVKDLSGTYKLELTTERGLSEFTQTVEVLDPVPKPEVSCVQEGNTTRLFCFAKDHQVQFRWSGPDLDGMSWGPMNGSADIIIGKQGSYSCEVKNPVSEKKQSFHTKDCGSTEDWTTIIAVIVAMVLIFILTVIACFIKKHCTRKGSDGNKPGVAKREDRDNSRRTLT